MSKKTPSKKPEIDYRRTLLAVVRGSVGTKGFRQLFLWQNKKSVDVLRDGELSCAFFVSNMLRLLGLVKEGHATVNSTMADMKDSGWKRIRQARPGAVVTWGPVTYADRETHGHIGFVVAPGRAVSTSYRQRKVVEHGLTYAPKGSKKYRPVETLWWHPKLGR